MRFDGSNPRVVSFAAEVGSVGGFGGKDGREELYYALSPPSQRPFTRDITKGIHPLSMPDVAFELDDFESLQEWYMSKDGTRVPMFIVHKKGRREERHQPDLAVRSWWF